MYNFRVGHFGNWGNVEPESIFGAKVGRMAFYEAHTEELDNLFNDSYWRGKMTPKHMEMRRHPNRSSGWIPQEILKERDDLFVMWLTYLLEDHQWSPEYDNWRWPTDEVCRMCGTDEETCNQRLVDEKNGNGTTYSPNITFGWCNFCRPDMEKLITWKTEDIRDISSRNKKV